MTLGNYIGTIDQWEYSTNGGSTWNFAGGGSSQHSDVLTSAGTYIYRVKVSCNSATYYSTTRTVEVKAADGGTISTGGGNICTGGTPETLSLNNEFVGQGGGLIQWEYSTNGGTSYSVDGSGTNQDPYTPNLSSLGGAGTYIYRAKVSCGISNPDYSSNTKTYQVNNPTQAAVCNDPDELRRAVAKVSIPGILYPFSGFLVNHTQQDGRLLFLTTSHPFTRYNPSATALNNATFTWNEDLSACNGSASSSVTSVGCTLLVTDGFFTLLELNAAPAMPQGQLFYLGWDINATGSYSSIFQSAGSIRKGKVATTGSPSTVSGSFTTGTDNFVESSGSGVFKFTNWSSGNTEKRGRGAPLLAGSIGKKARGVYIAGDEATCGNGPSYFAYLTSSMTGLLSYLRDGSETNTATVRLNYCIPYLNNLPSPLGTSETYQVSDYILSAQNIFNGHTVRYKAGTYIEMKDGFISGTDFVAEIDPCVSIVTVLAAKTEDEVEQQQTPSNITSQLSGIKIYPTAVASGTALNIEVTEPQESLQLEIYDLQGNRFIQSVIYNLPANQSSSINLQGLASGFYLVKANGTTISATQKIVVL